MEQSYDFEWENKRKKLLFIYNPASGREMIKNKLSDIIQVFCEADFIVTLMATNRPNDAKNAVIEYGAGYDYVVCSGGDGTINETASGLMHLDKKPICGYIPAGTVNDFASSLSIPSNMRQAAELVTEGNVFRCDIGVFNDRFFTYVAGFGAFTEVSYTTPQEWKNMLGKTAYYIEGLKHLAEIKPHHMKITYDEGEVEGDFVLGLVSNSISVGGMKVYKNKDIKMDDGLFEVLFVRDIENPLELQEIINALLNNSLEAGKLFYCSSQRIHIVCEEEVAWTLDGEDGGSWREVDLVNKKQVLPILCGRETIENLSVN